MYSRSEHEVAIEKSWPHVVISLVFVSLTSAMAVHSAQEGRSRALIVLLLLTMLIGMVFLGIKGTEYVPTYHERLVPGLRFDYRGPQAG